MPLTRSPDPISIRSNGDIAFTMSAPDGTIVACEADADYLIALGLDQ